MVQTNETQLHSKTKTMKCEHVKPLALQPFVTCVLMNIA